MPLCEVRVDEQSAADDRCTDTCIRCGVRAKRGPILSCRRAGVDGVETAVSFPSRRFCGARKSSGAIVLRCFKLKEVLIKSN